MEPRCSLSLSQETAAGDYYTLENPSTFNENISLIFILMQVSHLNLDFQLNCTEFSKLADKFCENSFESSAIRDHFTYLLCGLFSSVIPTCGCESFVTLEQQRRYLM